MSFLPSVIRAEYCGGFRIHVTFNDNSEKTIDFREWLKGPVFEPLKARTDSDISSSAVARSRGRTVPTSLPRLSTSVTSRGSGLTGNCSRRLGRHATAERQGR